MKIGLALGSFLAATALVGQDKEALKTALKDAEVSGPWIYDDVNAGYAEAKKSAKPMLVVFR